MSGFEIDNEILLLLSEAMCHVVPKALNMSVLMAAGVILQPAPYTRATVQAAMLLHPLSDKDISRSTISAHATGSVEQSEPERQLGRPTHVGLRYLPQYRFAPSEQGLVKHSSLARSTSSTAPDASSAFSTQLLGLSAQL